jgi:hypothetical protein
VLRKSFAVFRRGHVLQIALTAPDGPCHSWRRREGQTCPCRDGGQCRGARRLVDDNEMLVFVNDVEVNVFGLWFGWLWRGDGNFESLAWFELLSNVGRCLAINHGMAVDDQPLKAGTTYVRVGRGQRFVEAFCVFDICAQDFWFIIGHGEAIS